MKIPSIPWILLSALPKSHAYSTTSLHMMAAARPRSLRYDYFPKSGNQQKYVDSLYNPEHKVVIATGPAGTGKTLFACIHAAKLLQSGEMQKVIITRPLISVENEEIGFLPGNIARKMDPWTRPIYDIFLEQFQKQQLDSMIHNNIIEICPLAFMRGRTFKRAIVIADEMQNSTPNQMKMLLTRVGRESKIVVTGDLHQTDRNIVDNGLYDLLSKYQKRTLEGKPGSSAKKRTSMISWTSFTTDDVERSDVVKCILDLYEEE